MSYNSAFDEAAAVYDTDFTYSTTGRAQRKIVHEYLEKNLNNWKSLHVLELNCGTGEDAVYLASGGAEVLATDSSEKMLEVAGKKIKSAGLENKICIKKIDIAELGYLNFGRKFDLIFSNFGGLNCVDGNKLKELSGIFRTILKPHGRMIFIIMPPSTLWEISYFIFKRKFKEAFRRRKKSGIEVKIKESSVRAYYYSPGEIRKIFAENFIMNKLSPLGFFIPPSYLENFFKGKIKLFAALSKLENFIRNISALSSFSDHYIIDLEARQ
jgi:ubiquinone/menaquinone biosynthesis C-methylase UbiE